MKISIVIPIYNVERWLPKCLDSVLSQTLADFEVLCVDDGSTDGSAAILEEYSQRDGRIKVFHQENAGAGSARNHGLDEATGEYVVFMDPDDFYPVFDVLEKLYNAVTASGCQIAGGRLCHFSEDEIGRVTSWIAGDPFPHFGVVPYREYQTPYWYYCYIYSRELLERVHLRFPPYRRFQDPPFFIRAMLEANDFFAIEDVVYCWRIGHKQVAWDADKCRLLREHFGGALEVLRLAEENALDKIFLKIVKQSFKLVDRESRYQSVKDIFGFIAQEAAETRLLPGWRKFQIVKYFLREEKFLFRLMRFIEFPNNFQCTGFQVTQLFYKISS